jgi:hypothetical protein
VGLSVSAIITWLAYLSLLVFDIDKEQVEIRKDDEFIEYKLDEYKSEIDGLIEQIRDGKNKSP